MDQSSLSSTRRVEPEFNLREWTLKAQISGENKNSRRFSASNLTDSIQEARFFSSNITISSTASSPGYSISEEIDRSTYSFTNALKALQARSAYSSWECSSPDGLALNSKWNNAEKYICNPLSGEVPMECLSARSLSGRSFRNLASKIATSAPIYPSNLRPVQTNPSFPTHKDQSQLPTRENKVGNMTRDVGTQSTPPKLSSSSPVPTSTPPIEERSVKFIEEEGRDSTISSANFQSEEDGEVKEAKDKEETKRNQKERKETNETCRCGEGGCLSWRILWMRRKQRDTKAKKEGYLSSTYKWMPKRATKSYGSI